MNSRKQNEMNQTETNQNEMNQNGTTRNLTTPKKMNRSCVYFAPAGAVYYWPPPPSPCVQLGVHHSSSIQVPPVDIPWIDVLCWLTLKNKITYIIQRLWRFFYCYGTTIYRKSRAVKTGGLRDSACCTCKEPTKSAPYNKLYALYISIYAPYISILLLISIYAPYVVYITLRIFLYFYIIKHFSLSRNALFVTCHTHVQGGALLPLSNVILCLFV
jgi:hypothetical protein